MVLLVEDDDDLRTLYAEVLTARDYRVVTASTGREALALLDGVDVIVTDFSMPDVDGVELARAVRADPAHCCVHLVLMSAAPPEELDAAVHEVGARFLPKPFDLAHLIEAIEGR